MPRIFGRLRENIAQSNLVAMDEFNGNHSIASSGSSQEGSGLEPSSSVSQAQRVGTQPADELYRLKLNTVVKPYKNAQNRTGESLGIININVSSLDTFRASVFAIISDHVEGIAVLEGGNFSMRAQQVAFFINWFDL